MNKFYRFRMSLLAMTACLLTPFLSATAYTITTPFQLNDNVRSVTDRQAAYADASSTYDVIKELGDPIMSIACISDIHTEYDKNSTNFNIRESFQKAVNAIKSDEDIDLMIIGGDCNNSSNYSISQNSWKYAVNLLKTTAQSAFQNSKTAKPVFLVDGNHDYESGSTGYNVRPSWNSGDYYDAILKSTIGELTSDDTFYEKTNDNKYNLLAAFHYEINGFDFIGLNTGKYLYDFSGDYNYSKESVEWVVNKLDAIDPDGTKTVFVVAHIPFGDSNSIRESSKGMGSKDGSADALKKGLAKHPNTIMLYGHDHGGDKAYTKEKTSQRVTRYDKSGNKLNGPTDATHVNGLYITDAEEEEESSPSDASYFYIQSVENSMYMAQGTSGDVNRLVLESSPSLVFTAKKHSTTSGALAVYAPDLGKYLFSGSEKTFSVADTSNPTYLFKKGDKDWTRVSQPTVGEQYVIAVKGKSDSNYYAVVNTNKIQTNNGYPRLDYVQVKMNKDCNKLEQFNPTNLSSMLWTFVAAPDYAETGNTGSVQSTDYFFSEFMGSMRYYDNTIQNNLGGGDQSNYTNTRVLVQGLMIYIYNDRIVFQHKNYGQAPVSTGGITVQGELTPYTVFRQVTDEPVVKDVESVTLAPTTLSFDLLDAQPATLTATVAPKDATNPALTWTSSNTAVATVDNGVVTPKGVGTCTISATTTDGTEITATCDVTVTQTVKATSITLDITSLPFDLLDAQPATLTATVNPSNTTNAEVAWSSSNEAVATVADGVVTPKGVGTCTITAATTDGTNLSASCGVTVTETVLVKSINLSEVSHVFGKGNYEPIQLTATVMPENATNKEVYWSSSNETVATVNEDGVVTPLKEGYCNIKAVSAENAEVYTMCYVQVLDVVLVKEITLSESTLNFNLWNPESIQLTATVSPSNADVNTVNWSTSDANVATVTADGIVTPTGRGTCAITATAADESGVSAACDVTVKTSVELIHQQNYTNKTEMECDEITYSRTFTTTNWQALYVPFRMNSSQWTNDFTIAYISGIHTYDEDGDGTIDRQTVEVIYIKNGTLKPNYPYVIKAKQTGSYEFTSWDNMLYAAEEKSLTCNTTTHDYTFTGIYTPRDYKFLRIDNKAYFFSGGQLKYLADTSTASLLPNSMYLLITPKKDEDLPYDADYTYPKSIEIRTVGYEEDGDVTYIDDVTMDETLEEAPMWSIDGRPVNGNDMESLAPGIYVKQGKKILIR